MSDMHICAECTDFIGGGDWGLCCKSLDYNALCYEFTAACERFKPGRKIRPVILYAQPDGRAMVREFNSEKCFARYVELAKETIAEGNSDVRIVDASKEWMPLLWHEKHQEASDG